MSVPAPAPSPERLYDVLINDLACAAAIGVYEHEYGRLQPLRISLRISAIEPAGGFVSDAYAEVISYDKVAAAVRALCQKEHVGLIETLAERIAALCLGNPLTRRVMVRIEKIEAVAGAIVGIEIVRPK